MLSSHQHSFHCQDFLSQQWNWLLSFMLLLCRHYVFILLVPRLFPLSLFRSFKSRTVMVPTKASAVCIAIVCTLFSHCQPQWHPRANTFWLKVASFFCISQKLQQLNRKLSENDSAFVAKIPGCLFPIPIASPHRGKYPVAYSPVAALLIHPFSFSKSCETQTNDWTSNKWLQVLS